MRSALSQHPHATDSREAPMAEFDTIELSISLWLVGSTLLCLASLSFLFKNQIRTFLYNYSVNYPCTYAEHYHDIYGLRETEYLMAPRLVRQYFSTSFEKTTIFLIARLLGPTTLLASIMHVRE
jgi:hypothetical protein